MAKTDCIDISYANTGLDYKKLKSKGIKAAIIRVGQRDFKDNMFEAHYSGVKNAGMKIGAYWFTEAHNTDEAKTEAKRCIKYLSGKKLNYPIYVDIEDYAGNNWYPSKFGKTKLTEIAMTFCSTIQASGYKAGVYASASFYGSVLDYKKIKKSYSIWLAHWGVDSPSYNCDIWQTGVGTLPGSNGAIDKDSIISTNFASGTNALEEFLKVAKKHSIDKSESFEEWTKGVLGLKGYVAWCAHFVRACAKTAGVLGTVIGDAGNVSGIMEATKKLGGKIHSASNYTPKPGDLFFLTGNSHVGIVYSVNGKKFTSCEGNHVINTMGKNTQGYLSGSTTYTLPNNIFYRFCTPDWESVGGFSSGTDDENVGGGQLYDTEYNRSDAIIREVGYLDKKYKPTTKSSKMKLCVMNYTSLLADIWEKYGYGGSSGTSGTTGNANYDTSALSGNAKIVIDYFLNKGLNAAAACGFAGNLWQESHSFNPGEVSSDGAIGIVQWMGGRASAMKTYVGKNWKTNLSGQLDFLWHEITTSYKDTYNYVKKVTNTVDGTKKAAKYICEHYEVGTGVTARQNKAVEYFKKIKQISTANQGQIIGTPNSRGWVWPTPGYTSIVSVFGENRGYPHGGVDIGAPMGAKVVAGKSGTVESCCNTCTHNYGKNGSCGCGGGFGNNVYINHGGGYLTIYGHLTKAMVSTGQKVSAGQQIGTVGSTGWSTGAHLHYELHINGAKSDPMQLYSKGDIR